VDWTRLPLARAAVDRAAHRRVEPDLLDRALADPTTQIVLVSDGSLATRDGGLDLLAPGDVPPGQPLWLYLGEDGGTTALAAVLATPDSGRTWQGLRELGHRLPDRDAGLAAAAVALAAWHARHQCCPRCGAATVPALGGWTRRCTRDGSEHYPRTDPAVIVAVTDPDDRLLLAHAAHWPERRFSTLAGYVEPGESAEQAVVREVGEEAGILVGDLAYRGSQPWPFPASLMLAYTARTADPELTVDGVEVTHARWFARPELLAAATSGEVVLPSRTSVARALIEDWYGSELPTGTWGVAEERPAQQPG
jgi:NAD+ diphosphatase